MVPRPLLPRLPVLLLAASALAGCSGDVNPVRDAFIAAGAGAERPRAQGFVAQTRPSDDKLDYRPVSATPSPRRLRSKTQAEVSAAEAEMDAVRTRNDQSATDAQATAGSANAAAGRAGAPTN